MSHAERTTRTYAIRTATGGSLSTTGIFATLAALLRARGSGAQSLGASVVLGVVGMFLVAAPLAQASFGLNDFDVTFTNADGSPATQAGSHPCDGNLGLGCLRVVELVGDPHLRFDHLYFALSVRVNLLSKP